MSRTKNKIHMGFRVDSEVIEKIDDFVTKKPDLFRSRAEFIDAALWHFVNLNINDLKAALKAYLTKKL